MRIAACYDTPIPQMPSMDGWKECSVDTNAHAYRERLMAVGSFSYYPEIVSDAIYAGERRSSPYGFGELEGSLLTSFVRRGVAERLVEANARLPARHILMTLDTFRTEAVQTALFNPFKEKLLQPPFNRTEAQATEETQQYVSLPSRPNSPHMTGAAVDLTIVRFDDNKSWTEHQVLTRRAKAMANRGVVPDDKDWPAFHKIEARRGQLLREATMLDMGVAFDEVSIDAYGDRTALRYFEDKLEKGAAMTERDLDALKNRRLLYHTLTAVGFTLYPAEPWHADLGDKVWSKITGKPAIYGFATLSDTNKAFEAMRRAVYQEEIQKYEAVKAAFKSAGKEITAPSSDPRFSKQPELCAHRISPDIRSYIGGGPR
ncbi:MAG: M15 family metallopeptidase [Alphaproteobacteria bacterium]|nr:M15 family metallopeptidase [Alphaproteobacteria bacterium]